MKNAYKKGDIVLIKFPFTDLLSSKVRPALIMRDQSDDDITVLPISTTINLQPHDILIKNEAYQKNPLPVESAIRIGKIGTLHERLVIKKVSQLKAAFFAEVQQALFRYLSQ
jgi:mRNA interferase MazF